MAQKNIQYQPSLFVNLLHHISVAFVSDIIKLFPFSKLHVESSDLTGCWRSSFIIISSPICTFRDLVLISTLTYKTCYVSLQIWFVGDVILNNVWVEQPPGYGWIGSGVGCNFKFRLLLLTIFVVAIVVGTTISTSSNVWFHAYLSLKYPVNLLSGDYNW